MKDAVVKIDKELLAQIEKLIEKDRFVYSSKKQVINLAIIEFLNKYNLKLGRKRGKHG